MLELGFWNQSDFDLRIASLGQLLVWFLVKNMVWFWDFLVWFSAWQHCYAIWHFWSWCLKCLRRLAACLLPSHQDTVSVHRPGFYAQRFMDFMSTKIFKKIPSCKHLSRVWHCHVSQCCLQCVTWHVTCGSVAVACRFKSTPCPFQDSTLDCRVQP